jgi:tetratricopeptide (TPR) repeat protein
MALFPLREGRLSEAAEGLAEALRRFSGLGDRRGAAVTLVNLSDVHRQLGELEPARNQAEEALSLARETAYLQLEPVAIAAVARTLCQADPDEAQCLFEQALELHRKVKDVQSEAGTLLSLADLLMDREWVVDAETVIERALEITDRPGAERVHAECGLRVARLRALEGDRDRAQASWSRAATVLKSLGAAAPVDSYRENLNEACAKHGLTPLCDSIEAGDLPVGDS